MDELKLIEGCLKRDKKSWDLFVQKYSRLIYWAIRKRASAGSYELSREYVDSIFQEVFLSILEGDKLSRVKDPKAVSGWLVITASNKTIDFVRSKINQERRLVPDMPELAISDFKEDISYGDLLNTVKSTIEKLPSREKVILSLNILKEKTHKEIAAIMDIPQNTVSTIISRAKERLKDELIRQGIENL
jgi:RNA polymerase sigma factor (sigma-70 family)